MSLSTRSYSKESRSSSYYSRSASYHATTSSHSNNFQTQLSTSFDRPLSQRLIEREYSWPSLDYIWDDPFYFDRLRWRWDDDFYKYYYGLGRAIPITYRNSDYSSFRSIPIQYKSSLTHLPRRRLPSYKRSDSDDSIRKHDESLMMRENRISSDDWPPRQEPPTRKRSSMTIFIQHPYIDHSTVPYYKQTLPTPTYHQSVRTDYY